MDATAMLTSWIKGQKPKALHMKDSPVFLRNLEEALDARRVEHGYIPRIMSAWKLGKSIDFSSNDLLWLGSNGMLRNAFFEELSRHPDFNIYSGGTRVADGNYSYLELVEQEIADFHSAETSVLVGSGFEANVAIYSAIPRPGDAIIYDELVHASVHDGMAHSAARLTMPFQHNDVDAFREALVSVLDSQPMIRDGLRCILISVESVYSMDGDVCPLLELIEIAKEVCPKGNAVFIVDEAHGTGIIGPRGAGLVNALGCEKDITIRLHTYGKALASSGAAILAPAPVRGMITNFARSFIYTTSPSFLTAAAVRAGYNLMRSGATEKLQANIQHTIKYFFRTLSANPIYQEASKMGILSVPLAEDWEDREFLVHCAPVWTRQRYNYWLFFHLQLNGICAFPIEYPVVPKGQSRVRLMFHSGNTEEHVDKLVAELCEFAQEMIELEKGPKDGQKVPKAAQQVYALMAAA